MRNNHVANGRLPRLAGLPQVLSDPRERASEREMPQSSENEKKFKRAGDTGSFMLGVPRSRETPSMFAVVFCSRCCCGVLVGRLVVVSW